MGRLLVPELVEYLVLVPRPRGRFSFSAVVENNDPVYVVNRF